MVFNQLKQFGLVLLEIVLFTLLSLLLSFGLMWLIYFLSGELDPFQNMNDATFQNPYRGLIHEYFPMFISVFASWYLVHVVLFKRPFSRGGFIERDWFFKLGKGYFIGAAIIIFGFLILFMGQVLKLSPVNWNASFLFGFFIFFLVQSAVEEIMMRSFLIPLLEVRLGIWVSLILSASVFSVIHIFNPNFSVISSINIFLGGLALGLLFIQYRSFWLVTGFHAAWNFIQASFFDFNVSGHNVYSFVQFEVLIPDWFSGGDFGFEGSIVSIILLFVAVVWLFRNMNYNLNRYRIAAPYWMHA